MDADKDAVAAYGLAMRRLRAVRRQWVAEGSPLTLAHPNGVVGVHPLWKVLLEAESFAARLREKVRPARPVGRPKAAASSPDRVERPGTLRVVS